MQKKILKLITSLLTISTLIFSFTLPSVVLAANCSITASNSSGSSTINYSITNCDTTKSYNLVFRDHSAPIGADISSTPITLDASGGATGSVTAPQAGTYDLNILNGITQVASVSVSVAGAAQPPAPAAPGPWYNQNFGQWSTKVFDTSNPNEIFGERYTFAQVNWIVNSLIAILSGPAVSKCASSANITDVANCMKGLPLTSNSGGAIGTLAFLTGTLLNARPVSGIQYVKTTASRLHIIPQAYAQSGAGYSTLNPIQSLWTVVRDISYAMMVVVIVAMAFLIMFRVKISPQVMITVQSALPKVVIALILITFSYAIAGFLIDLSYVAVGVFATMVKIGGGSVTTIPHVADLFTQLNSINGLASITIGLILFVLLLAVIGSIVGGAAITVPIFGLGVSIILLVGVVFILWILVRLFWLMLKTATITVLLIIAGPLIILMEALGIGGGFMGWIRNLAANLAVYPVVTIMIFLSHYFFWGWFLGTAAGPFGGCGQGSFNTYCIAPVGFGVVNFPGMPLGTPILGFFVAIVILFLIPKAAEVTEGIITGKGVKAAQESAIKESIGPSAAVLAGHFAEREAIRGLPGGPGGKSPLAQALRALGLPV